MVFRRSYALGDKSSRKNPVGFDISNCWPLDERHGVIIGERSDRRRALRNAIKARLSRMEIKYLQRRIPTREGRDKN